MDASESRHSSTAKHYSRHFHRPIRNRYKPIATSKFPSKVTYKKKALFLDRDGVINEDRGYVYQYQDFTFTPGIFELCKKAQKRRLSIVVITNQSGLARAYYDEEDYQTLNRWMLAQFRAKFVRIQGVFHCPHHPDFSGQFGRQCVCRKPKPGLFFKAKKKLKLNLEQSFMVGDRVTDLKAAQAASIEKRVLLNPNWIQYSGRLKLNKTRQFELARQHKQIISMIGD